MVIAQLCPNRILICTPTGSAPPYKSAHARGHRRGITRLPCTSSSTAKRKISPARRTVRRTYTLYAVLAVFSLFFFSFFFFFPPFYWDAKYIYTYLFATERSGYDERIKISIFNKEDISKVECSTGFLNLRPLKTYVSRTVAVSPFLSSPTFSVRRISRLLKLSQYSLPRTIRAAQGISTFARNVF